MLLGDGTEQFDGPKCMTLLAGESVGRIAFTVGSLPVIVPVRYVLVDGDVVFKASPGARVRAAIHDAVVAFEVDGVDDRGFAWRVLAVGRARELEHAEERARAAAHGLDDRADSERAEFVRLHPELLEGERAQVG